MLTLLALLVLLYFHVTIHWWIFILWLLEAFYFGRSWFRRM